METAGVTNINSALKLKRKNNKIGWKECSGLSMLQDVYCHDMYLINSLHLSLMSFRNFPEVQTFWLPIPLMASRQILFIRSSANCRHAREGVQRHIPQKKRLLYQSSRDSQILLVFFLHLVTFEYYYISKSLNSRDHVNSPYAQSTHNPIRHSNGTDDYKPIWNMN